MSDDVCAVLCTACCQVCTGIWVDFVSLRHGFTENLCRFSCFREDKNTPERRPLLSENPQQQHHDHTQQLEAQPPMQISKT